MPLTKKVLSIYAIVVSLIVGLGVAFFMFFIFMMSGGAGWHPNRQSERAVRAYAIDGSLRPGMQKSEVLRLFKADVAQHPDDMVDETDVTFNAWDRPCPGGTCATNGGRQFELIMFDPPQLFDGFGTAWSVRTQFDSRGRLAKHVVHMGDCCGP